MLSILSTANSWCFFLHKWASEKGFFMLIMQVTSIVTPYCYADAEERALRSGAMYDFSFNIRYTLIQYFLTRWCDWNKVHLFFYFASEQVSAFNSPNIETVHSKRQVLLCHAADPCHIRWLLLCALVAVMLFNRSCANRVFQMMDVVCFVLCEYVIAHHHKRLYPIQMCLVTDGMV